MEGNPEDKIEDAYPVLIVTLPLTPLVPALNVFNSSDPELVMPHPNPIVPVTPLTDTAPPVVEPSPDAKDRYLIISPDDGPAVKEASPQVAGEKFCPNLQSQGKTIAPNISPTDSRRKL